MVNSSDANFSDPGEAAKSAFAGRLLAWYDDNRRVLPWRAEEGVEANPYHVWLSEIMLQQTTVATVKAYFAKFLELWPSIQDLAAAPLDDVLTAWAGLGYYARARNLHKCAVEICENRQGVFPRNEADLRDLPGIGDYTAAAIASIAFDQRAIVVDGNVERVIARWFALEDAMPKAKPVIKQLADQVTPLDRQRDFPQAMMDLGATLCSPKSPTCLLCPLSQTCQAFQTDEPLRFPVKAAKKVKPTRFGHAYWISDGQGRVLLRRREERGLLGGMMEVPGSEWMEGAVNSEVLGRALPGEVKHTFTHFHLVVTVYRVEEDHPLVEARKKGATWAPLEELDRFALPTIMKKIVKHALEN